MECINFYLNTQASVWLQAEALRNRTDTSNHTKDKWSSWKQLFCSPVFSDISEVFDKVWHTGLLYKSRWSLPLNYFLVLISYLHNRHFLMKVEIEYTELSPVKVDIPQGSVLGPLLYLLYTADLPTSPESITATFSDDTPVVATDSDPTIASHKLQNNLLAIQNWFKKWRIKANRSKSVHITFTTQRKTCPTVHINNVQLPHEDVKYLRLHLDRRLTWHKFIFAKRKQLGITLANKFLLLGCKSKLSISN
jgi:hypothetical protein